MSRQLNGVEDLNQEQLIEFVMDIFHRTLVHYAMWYREVGHQLGPRPQAEADRQVFKTSLAISMKRMAKLLGFEVDEKGIPKTLKQMNKEQLLDLAQAQAVNWLANDGVWFQKVETMVDMDAAKRINDTCWTQFSPYEAESIKRFLGLGEQSGLEGLKKALGFRNYALINRQSIHQVDENSFVFQMNDCRVQSARKRKGLPDYPCQSAGKVEYPYFAKTIDTRIKTECVGCPPGDHPEEWYCAWKFTLEP